MLRLSIITATLLVSISVSAGENAFTANLENPSVSTLITEFEKVCFPFISHQTELTAQQDREVFQSHMVEAEYAFEDEKRWSERTRIGNFSYSQSTCQGPLSKPAAFFVNHSSRQFTVFKPAKGQIIQLQKSTADKKCEILPHSITPTRQTTYTRQVYIKNSERPMSASLVWQDISDFRRKITIGQRSRYSNRFEDFKVGGLIPPASSCGIHIHDESLTADIVESTIIAHDADWITHEVTDSKTKEVLPDAYNWQQCTSQDEEHYVYSASLIRGTLSMKVKTLQDDEEAPVYNCKALDEDRG